MSDSGAITLFLQDPHNRKRTNDFCLYCLHISQKLLSQYAARGYNFHLEDADRGKSLDNRANDLLGFILHTGKGTSCSRVFHYFKGKGLYPTDGNSEEVLAASLRVFLRVQLKQQWLKELLHEDPESAGVRNRLNEILTSSIFTRIPSQNGRRSCLKLASCLHKDSVILIDDFMLHDMISRTFMSATAHTAIVEGVFELIEGLKNHSHEVVKRTFVNLFCDVVANHFNDNISPGSQLSNPEQALLLEEARKQAEATYAWITENELTRLAVKRGLTAEDATAISKGLNDFLADLGEDGYTNLIPSYLKRNLSPENSSQYETKYKYVFETIVQKATEHFKLSLSQSPIIRAHRGYRIDEKEGERH